MRDIFERTWRNLNAATVFFSLGLLCLGAGQVLAYCA
jgi:hypothetical protein